MTEHELNAAQKQAVECLDGPLLVLAGAGTGKTRVLTHRVAEILHQGRTQAYRILCVTFTNKAAREMRERITALAPDKVEGLWLGTFHSLAVRILRRFPKAFGLSENFLIMDSDDQYRLLRQILQDMRIDPKQVRPGMVMGYIQAWKDRCLEPDRVPDDEAEELDGLAIAVYRRYQRHLLSLDACDFGDLLLYNIKVFAHQPEVLHQYQERFRYILVDEYQDTNYIQNLWLSLLAHQHRQLCCVGDDDQSIYGWRGAEVRNILEFQNRFKEAKVIRLEENYRSTQNILDGAAGIITKNTDRLGKSLLATRGEGEKIGLAGFWDSRGEAMAIADEVSKRMSMGQPLSGMAILIRAGHISQMLETTLAQARIPYRIYGGQKFYEREEIRDAVAYLRLIVREDDALAFDRIINKPARGIGASSQDKLREYAEEHQVSRIDAARTMVEEGRLRGKAGKGLAEFLALHQQWQGQRDSLTTSELLHEVCVDAGIYSFWRASGKIEAEGKLENLGELESALSEFENLEAFLEHVALVMDDDRDSVQDKISVMTIHAAKGLEFDHVFLPAWEEGVFPNPRSLDENENNLQEERRLAYVAMTRAKSRLDISFARSRLTHGNWQEGEPSRFIREIPEEFLSNTLPEIKSAMVSSGWGNTRLRQTPRSKPKPLMFEQTVRELVMKSLAHGGKLGQRCRHKKFGEGTITGLDSQYYVIEFDAHGQKKISVDFIELLAG